MGSAELVIETGAFLSEAADVRFSPDGNQLAVCGDRVVRIYSVPDGELLQTLRGDRSHSDYGKTNCVSYSPDGEQLLVGINDSHPRGSLRLYQTERLSEIDRLVAGHTASTNAAAFDRSGELLATADSNGLILLWDWARQQITGRIPASNPAQPILDHLSFPTEHPILLAIDYQGPHLYAVPSGRPLGPGDQLPPLLREWLERIFSDAIAFPPGSKTPQVFDFQLDRNRWAAAGTGDQLDGSRYWVAFWTAANRGAKWTPTTIYRGHRWKVRAVALSPSGKYIASVDRFGEVHLWDAESGEPQFVIRAPGKSVYEVAFDPEGRYVAFGTEPNRGTAWRRNHFGAAERALDLDERVLRTVKFARSLTLRQEQLSNGRLSVTPERRGNNFYLVATDSAANQKSELRLPAGRNPTAITVLDRPALGIAQPILYGDDQGFIGLWDPATERLRRVYRGAPGMITSLSVSSDGNSFIAGCTDRTMRLYSLVDAPRVGFLDFKFENRAVLAVRPGTSSARAGVKPGDQIIRMDGQTLTEIYDSMLAGTYDRRPGESVEMEMRRDDKSYTYTMQLTPGFDYVEPILSFFVGNGDDWILWNPQGYYDCSPGADRLIGWHVNNGPDKAASFYGVGQFRQLLYRPDIINSIIAGGEMPEQVSSLRGDQQESPVDLRDAQQMRKTAPPVARFLSPQPSAAGKSVQLSSESVAVEVEAASANGIPLRSLTLLHNGSPAYVFRPDDQSGKSITGRHTLPLFPGKNQLALIADNGRSTSSGDAARLIIEAPNREPTPTLHALVVGISQYQLGASRVPNLDFADDDARGFAAALERHSGGRLYESVKTRVLLDDQANRAGIIDGFAWLAGNVKAGDAAIIFIASHAMLDDQDNFYLGCYDIDPDRVRATGVSWRELVDLLHKDLPACKRIVFVDACHSGGVLNPSMRSPLHDLSAPEVGTMFYASCSLQQQSYEHPEWEHGAFTKCLLDTLGDLEADFSPRSGDGLLNTLEVEASLSDKVRILTQDHQHPISFTPNMLRRINLFELSSPTEPSP